MSLDWFLYWEFLLKFESGIVIIDISGEICHDFYPTPKYYYGAQTEEDDMDDKWDKICNKLW